MFLSKYMRTVTVLRHTTWSLCTDLNRCRRTNRKRDAGKQYTSCRRVHSASAPLPKVGRREAMGVRRGSDSPRQVLHESRRSSARLPGPIEPQSRYALCRHNTKYTKA